MKVGDYVRDHTNGIGRVIKCYNNELEIVFNKATIKTTVSSYFEFNLNKSSPNIIDLIEVGDYVNGKKVLDVVIDYIFDYSEEIKIVYFDIDKKDYIYSKVDIKSIVTKEEFESMEYKVC